MTYGGPSDRTVTAEMGDVTAGGQDGILETNGIKADVAEPDVGKTDQKTDLHHRAQGIQRGKSVYHRGIRRAASGGYHRQAFGKSQYP